MALLTAAFFDVVDGGAFLRDQHHLRGRGPVDRAQGDASAPAAQGRHPQRACRVRHQHVVSASTICLFAIWVAVDHGGVAVFTALFSLFAAALYAAMNNHQIVWNLVIRLVFYSFAFFFITVKDL
jgi:hypothetical protein